MIKSDEIPLTILKFTHHPHKQKTPLLAKMPTGCNTIPRFTHRGGVCPEKVCPEIGII